MPSVKQLVSRAFDLLRRHGILLVPPLALALFNALLGPAGRGAGALLLIVSGLLSLAVTSGWKVMIARAEADQAPTWDDFFITIGRSFTEVLKGGLALAGLMFAGAVPILVATVFWVGPATIDRLAKAAEPLVAHPESASEALLKFDPSLLTALIQLASGLAVSLVWILAVWTALMFWQQAIVLGELGWRAAWRQSAGLLRQHFGYVMALLTVLSVFFFFGVALGAAPFPIGVLGWLAILGAQALSTVALTVFYLRATESLKKPAPSSDEPTASLN